jgi:hypothetical protein
MRNIQIEWIDAPIEIFGGHGMGFYYGEDTIRPVAFLEGYPGSLGDSATVRIFDPGSRFWQDLLPDPARLREELETWITDYLVRWPETRAKTGPFHPLPNG